MREVPGARDCYRPSLQAPSASLNCSGVARKRSSAKAAKAAGLVSPSARAFSIRRALKPSRSETKLDKLDMGFFEKRFQLVLQPDPSAPQLELLARYRPP